MKNIKLISLSFLLVFIAIALITNPELDSHIAATEIVYKDYVVEGMITDLINTKNEKEYHDKLIGSRLALDLVMNIPKNTVSRQNFFLFSLTKMKLKPKQKTIGIGAYGYVYIFYDFNSR
jgi:hypothetical protein